MPHTKTIFYKTFPNHRTIQRDTNNKNLTKKEWLQSQTKFDAFWMSIPPLKQKDVSEFVCLFHNFSETAASIKLKISWNISLDVQKVLG